MSFHPNHPYPAKCQAGMALLLCLLFLTALTLLGLSASADAVLQNQLAANLQETERARQSAQLALSWAEDWLLGLPGAAPKPCVSPCGGFYIHPTGDLLPNPEFEDLSWWQAQGFEAGIDPRNGNRLATPGAGSANPPVWIVEVVHEVPASINGTPDAPPYAQAWYRILARGTGKTDTAVAVVESTVTRYWSADEIPAKSDSGRVSWRQLR